jgi:putative MATE family efflux protein
LPGSALERVIATAVRRSWLARLRERDHTQGRLVGSLLSLALPLLASSVAGGVVYQLVDLAFLSQLGGSALAAVVIVNQTIWQVVLMMAMGMNFATQAAVARAVGAGRNGEAEHYGGQSLLLAALLSAVIALIGMAFPERLFLLARPAPEFVPDGITYIRVTSLLGFGVVGGLLVRAVLIGAGDTTTPLLVTLVQTPLALLAEWILIFGRLGAPALGVQGVALGAAVGQWTALGLGIAVLVRGSSRVQLRARNFLPDVRTLGMLLRLSWPAALQMVGLVASSFVFLRLAGEFGSSVQTAYSVGLRLGMIVPAVSFPLATACATLVAQALGAGNVRRAWWAMGTGILVHGSVMWSFATLVAIFRGEIMALFSSDPEVVRIGSEYLLYAAGSFAVMAFYLVLLRALQGAGDVLVPMGISLGSTFLLSIPLAQMLSRTSLGPSGIWMSSLLGTLITASGTTAWAATGRWVRRGNRS